MANLLHTAKLGSDWGRSELAAYNIEIQFQDTATFFGVNPLPPTTVTDEVLTSQAADDMQDDSNYKLLRYIDLVMDPFQTEEPAVDDFAVYLLTILGYVPRSQMAHSDHILLLVQEDKRHKEIKDPEPQLVAGAIATFQSNNDKRVHPLGQDPLSMKVVPGITLVGSSLTFFKVPVTTELSNTIKFGIYPATPTVVYAHLPTVPRPVRRSSEGMKPLDNRRHILSCFEAFKRFVNWYNLLDVQLSTSNANGWP